MVCDHTHIYIYMYIDAQYIIDPVVHSMFPEDVARSAKVGASWDRDVALCGTRFAGAVQSFRHPMEVWMAGKCWKQHCCSAI